ncbi:MAG: RNA polymerase sigma factor RpoD/SigA [Bradymonadaceae bacterium]
MSLAADSATSLDDESHRAWLEGDSSDLRPVDDDGTAELDDQMSALDVYMARLSDLEPLSKDEQSELARRYHQQGDESAGQLLVMTNLRLVVKLAKEYAGKWEEALDLIQEGNVGITKALDRYDPSKNVKFTSYAQYWIRARILDYLINRGRTVRLGSTRASRKLFYNLHEVRDWLRDQGLDPTPERVAECLDVDRREVVRVTNQLDGPSVSLDQEVSDESTQTFGDLMEADDASPEEALEDEENRRITREALKLFGERLDDDRRRAIWFERTLADDPKYLRELGDDWEVSKERIRQIEAELHAEFRTFFRRLVGGRDEVKQIVRA